MSEEVYWTRSRQKVGMTRDTLSFFEYIKEFRENNTNMGFYNWQLLKELNENDDKRENK